MTEMRRARVKRKEQDLWCFYEFQGENRKNECLWSYFQVPEVKAEESCFEIPEDEIWSWLLNPESRYVELETVYLHALCVSLFTLRDFSLSRAGSMKMAACWVVALRRQVNFYRRFRGSCHLQHQSNESSLWWRRHRAYVEFCLWL
jgi:hypothetical protein